jgi:hypothetical protein
MKCHHHALTLSKKCAIISFWESEYLSPKDIDHCFEIPTSMLGCAKNYIKAENRRNLIGKNLSVILKCDLTESLI